MLRKAIGTIAHIAIAVSAGTLIQCTAEDDPVTPANVADAISHDDSVGSTAAQASQVEQASTPGVASDSSDAVILTLHTLKDPGSNNMDSHTLLAPAGWSVEGSAWWAHPNMFNIMPSQDVKVTSPQGVQIHIGPSIGAVDFIPSPMGHQYGARRPQEGTVDSGFPVLHMPSDLEQWRTFFLTKILPESLPEASDFEVEPVVVVPELTQVIQQQLGPTRQQVQQNNQHNQMMGLNMMSLVDGAVLAVSASYTLDGTRWERLYMFGTAFMLTDTDTGRQVHWSVEPNVAFTAPEGQLEANLPMLLSVGNSLRPTQQWAQMLRDHQAKMNQIAVQGAMDRSRIIAESNREVSRIISEGWEQRQASLDRSHRRTINAIRGVDDFVKPDGQQIQLPHNYQHVYTNGSQYILTNDPNYDPNRDQSINNVNWDRMRRAEP